MKIINFLIFICSLLLITAQASPVVASSSHQFIVVVYGDILTSNTYLPQEQTFPAQLEKRLRTTGFDVNVTAMGETDFTTSAALEKINSLVGIAPDIVILQLGETDIKRNFGFIGFSTNYIKIVDTLKKAGVYVIVMGAKAPETSDPSYATQIKDFFYFKIGRSVPLYPYTLQGVAGDEKLTMGDSHRPNQHGVAVMVNGIYGMVDAGLRWKIEAINKLRQRQIKGKN
jgi:acyl-CoA thioesterase-1